MEEEEDFLARDRQQSFEGGAEGAPPFDAAAPPLDATAPSFDATAPPFDATAPPENQEYNAVKPPPATQFLGVDKPGWRFLDPNETAIEPQAEPQAEVESTIVPFLEKFGVMQSEAIKAEVEAQKKGAKAPTPEARSRADSAWSAYPEHLRPEFLAGGLQLFPQGNYNEMLQAAVSRGDINQQQSRVAANAYKKWSRTLWGATVDNMRLNREMKHIRGRQVADTSLIRANEAYETSRVLEESGEAIKDQEALYKFTQDQYRRDYDAMLNKQSDAIDELSEMRIDPERWFQSRTTGQKIMAVISVGLGAVGASLSKGPNWAYNTIQSQINQDIDAQKAALTNARGAVAARQNLIGFFDRRLGNLDQATKMSRLFLNDYYTTRLKILGANAVNETQRRNYSAIMEAMAKDREVLGAELRRAAALEAARRAAAAAAAKAKQMNRGAILTPDQETKVLPMGNGRALFIPGASADQIKIIKERQNSLAYFRGANNKLREILQKYDSTGARAAMSSSDRADAIRLSNLMLVKLAEARGKNLTKLELDLLRNMGASAYDGRASQVVRDSLGISKGADGKLILPTDMYIENAAKDLDNTIANNVAYEGQVYGSFEKMKTGVFKESDTPVSRFVFSEKPVNNYFYNMYTGTGLRYGEVPTARMPANKLTWGQVLSQSPPAQVAEGVIGAALNSVLVPTAGPVGAAVIGVSSPPSDMLKQLNR